MHPYSKLEVYWAELITYWSGFSASAPISRFEGPGGREEPGIFSHGIEVSSG